MNEPTEPQPACIVCHAQQTRWGVCHGCIQRVDKMLADLLDAHALASVPAYLLPATRGNDAPLSGHRDPPLPLDLAVLELALGEDMLGVLECWERWFREEFGYAPYGMASADRLERAVSHESAEEVTLVGVVGFLRAQWPLAAEKHPAADEFAAEVRHLHNRALTALRMTEPKPTTIACPADLDDGLCGHRIPLTGGHDDLYCRRCGTRWTTNRLLLVAAVSGARVEISVEDAMAHYGCSRATVYRMVGRGELRRGRYGRVVIGSVEVAG